MTAQQSSLPLGNLRAWSRDWGGKLTLALIAFGALYFAWLATKFVGADHDTFISNLCLAIPGPAAALLSWRNSTHPGLDARSRFAWRIIGAAYLCFWIGDASWFYFEAVLGASPFPSPADFGFLAFYPLLLWGLLSFPLAPRSGAERSKFWLDAGTALVGGGMVAWHFALYGTFATQHESPLKALIALAYPVMDLVLFLGIATVLLRRPPAGSRNALSILVASLLIQVVYDLIFAYSNLNNAWQSATWPDAIWIGARLLAIVAAQYQFMSASQPATAAAGRADDARSFSLLPYIALAIGYGLLLFVGRNQWSSSLGGLIIGAIALTGLIAARQFAALRENAALLAERATRAGQQRFQALVQHASDVIAVVDGDGTLRYQSPALAKVLGFAPDYRLGESFATLVHPDDAAQFQRTIAATREESGPTSPVEVRLRHQDGVWRMCELVTNNLLADPTVGGIVITYRDITGRRALEDQLRRKALHDAPTSLPNQTLFLDRLEQALARAARRHELAAVLVLDIEELREVHDRLGQQTGDRLLADVAMRLQGHLRGGDTLARVGGETFAILLDGIDTQREATDVADRLLRAIETPFASDGRAIALGGTIGIALSTPEIERASELLRYANSALYRARQAGRGHYACFETSLGGARSERQSLQADLHHALERGEFTIHYQPRLRLADGEIEGVEALVRWQHPEHGLIPPTAFIPLVEESGMIRPLGRWILEAGCRQLAAWQQRYGKRAPYTLSINLSSKQFQRPGLVADVMRALRESGLPPEQLQCEIAERQVAEDPAATLRILLQLKGFGVRVAIDDVGALDPSLERLRQYPIDCVKIARSFVAGIGTDPESTAVVRAIIRAAGARGLQVAAAGIETADELAQLRALGCHLGQGFHFAPPLASLDIEPLLSAGIDSTRAAAEAAK